MAITNSRFVLLFVDFFMAKARALDRRRKSIRSIRKITRTMELISTPQFKRAMDRATTAAAYTRRITALVGHLAHSGLEVTHPLLQPRPETKRAVLLVLSANRGLCAGYNSSVVRFATPRYHELQNDRARGSRRDGRQARHFGLPLPKTADGRDVHPFQRQADLCRSRRAGEPLLARFRRRRDRSARRGLHEVRDASRQQAVVETLLPLGDGEETRIRHTPCADPHAERAEYVSAFAGPQYEFLPSAESILDEVVPTSFKVKLFKCFLDAAVSEQIARMVAMKAATENADSMISHLSMAYNRDRQGQITGELLEIIGGAKR